MNAACPISGVLVNEHAARVNAIVTVLVVALAVWTQWYWLLLILAVDFAIRGFANPKLSPLGKFSNALLKLAGVKPSMTDGGPKMFAAKIGFIFCLLIPACFYLGFPPAGYLLAAMIGLFALLEGLLNYCVGCKMYSLLCKLKS